MLSKLGLSGGNSLSITLESILGIFFHELLHKHISFRIRTFSTSTTTLCVFKDIAKQKICLQVSLCLFIKPTTPIQKVLNIVYHECWPQLMYVERSFELILHWYIYGIVSIQRMSSKLTYFKEDNFCLLRDHKCMDLHS